jgi:hypothetical protein
MAFAVKTYRRDPDGRPKLRLLVRCSSRRSSAAPGGPCGRATWRASTQPSRSSAAAQPDCSAPTALTPALPAAQARLRQPDGGHPPLGDLVEDYIDPIGLSLDDYAERLAGGWLFGFVEASVGSAWTPSSCAGRAT